MIIQAITKKLKESTGIGNEHLIQGMPWSRLLKLAMDPSTPKDVAKILLNKEEIMLME